MAAFVIPPLAMTTTDAYWSGAPCRGTFVVHAALHCPVTARAAAQNDARCCFQRQKRSPRARSRPASAHRCCAYAWIGLSQDIHVLQKEPFFQTLVRRLAAAECEEWRDNADTSAKSKK